MKRSSAFLFVFALIILCSSSTAAAAGKPHVISFGKVMNVKLFLGPTEDKTAPLAVRPLYVDGKLKEFTTGEVHDVTDRLFVVRRAFRVNNNLPDEDGSRKLPNWMWQKGGWLLVDRTTARISQIALPVFDPFYSHASWFRDYVAYCGLSDDQAHLFAVVAQLGSKKPLLKKEIGQPSGEDDPEADCTAPTWEKKPTKVTFHPKKGEATSFTVFGRAADMAPGSTEEDQ
jgi:hypothetical protein